MDLYQRLLAKENKLAVVGLGYVGLPLAVAFAKHFEVVGYDPDPEKIAAYRAGIDVTNEVGAEALLQSQVHFSSEEEDLASAAFYIVAVPTPINEDLSPDLTFLKNASELVGSHLQKGEMVVYESTVYPGATEETCIPLLEAYSRLELNSDFKVGYSPERINPGDPVNRLETITKLVSGSDEEALELITQIYSLIIEAGVYPTASIKIAEAAKVIENTQRDLNIAFMNELAMLFSQLGIETTAVLEAATTKWNFLNFKPGLVGGHCIGVDPYYLLYKAEEAGYQTRLIAAGRQINEEFSDFLAGKILAVFEDAGADPQNAKIGVLGLAYKADSADLRNTKVVDLIRGLEGAGLKVLVHDPHVSKKEAEAEYGLMLSELDEFEDLKALVVTVGHREFHKFNPSDFNRFYGQGEKILFDLGGLYSKDEFEEQGYLYWRL